MSKGDCQIPQLVKPSAYLVTETLLNLIINGSSAKYLTSFRPSDALLKNHVLHPQSLQCDVVRVLKTSQNGCDKATPKLQLQVGVQENKVFGINPRS